MEDFKSSVRLSQNLPMRFQHKWHVGRSEQPNTHYDLRARPTFLDESDLHLLSDSQNLRPLTSRICVQHKWHPGRRQLASTPMSKTHYSCQIRFVNQKAHPVSLICVASCKVKRPLPNTTHYPRSKDISFYVKRNVYTFVEFFFSHRPTLPGSRNQMYQKGLL